MGILDGLVSSVTSGLFGIWSGNRAAHAALDQQKQEQQFNAEQAQLNRDWQNEQRILQNEWNLDMWNRNNEYNSLSSQVQRALDAGVNPNLVFGNGAGIASSPAQGAPVGSGAQAQTSSIADTLANAELQKVNAAKTAAETVGQGLENAFNSKSFEARLEEIKTNIDLSKSNKLLTDAQAEVARENAKWIAPLNENTINLLRSQASEVLQHINNLVAEEELTKKTSELRDHEMNLIDAQTSETLSNRNLLDEKLTTEQLAQRKMQKEIDLLEKEKKLKDFLIKFQEETGLPPDSTLLPATRKLYGDISIENVAETLLTLFGVTVVGGLSKGGKVVGKLLNKGKNLAKKLFKSGKGKVNGNTITWNM